MKRQKYWNEERSKCRKKGVYTLAVIGKSETITYFYLTESGGKTKEAMIISCGGIATSQL